MGVLASLSSSLLAVVPGSEVGVDVKVRNTGTVIDQFTVEVLGEAAAWATIDPPSVSLFPSVDGIVHVAFRPPRTGETPTGAVVFGVRVLSKEDPAGSVVEEGTLDIAPYSDVVAELVPRASRSRRAAKHQLAVDNRGNARLNATIEAYDADQVLTFEIDPPALVAEPNAAAFARVRVKPRKRFLRGTPQNHMFEVTLTPEGQLPVVAQGMLLQEPVLPRWFGRAVGLALLGLVALAVLWLVVLKPVVKSTAEDAARREVTPATIGINGGGGKAGSKSVGGTATTVAGADTTGTGAVVAGQGSPIDGRLFLTANGSVEFEVPAGSTLQLTDIVLQNPNGETGPLQIRRNDNPLLVVDLGNFRDLDYHFVAPIVFTGGQKLVLNAQCTTPTCTPGAYFSGFISKG